MYVLGTHKGVEKAIPIIRRLIPCGHSQGVTLPKTWLQMAEEKEGKKIVAVAMEVNGCLTINPIFEKEKANVTPRQENHASQQTPTSARTKELTIIE